MASRDDNVRNTQMMIRLDIHHFRRCLRCIVAVVGAMAGGAAQANVRLPRLVGDGMVLQRDAPITIWGWADPSERIRIGFNGDTVTAIADQTGQWSVQFGAYAAGGPYEMILSGKNRLVIHDILIGDVWLASGQSNMEFPLQAGPDEWMTGVLNAEQEIATADYPQIRLFVVNHDAALRPKADVTSTGWHSATPRTVGSFSAVAYLFGRGLYNRYHVPVGLVESSCGGTVAEAWMSRAALKPFSEFDQKIDAMAHVTDDARTAFERIWQQREAWYREHGSEDRGHSGGRYAWAEPTLDTSDWSSLELPRPENAWGQDFNGYDGVIWLRRTLTVPPALAGKELTVHFGATVQDDITWFNGQEIGATQGFHSRTYVVPAQYVRPGENSVAVRLVGEHNSGNIMACGIGIYGAEDQMYAEVGGTRIPLSGAWHCRPGPDLHDFPFLSEAAVAAAPDSNAPTALFNGMIDPLMRFRIKGAIWYQGESNVGRAPEYRKLFPALIEDWRSRWGYTYPFLLVQLAGYGQEVSQPAGSSWAELREAQAGALSLPDVGMATAVDLGEPDDVHPRNKQEVARRMVLTAAKTAYGENIISVGPTFEWAKTEGSRVRVHFADLGAGLQIRDKYGYARGFDVAGSDGKYFLARARQDGQDLVVYSTAVAHPVAVRYDWSNNPDGNLYNREGLPALPFRANVPEVAAPASVSEAP